MKTFPVQPLRLNFGFEILIKTIKSIPSLLILNMMEQHFHLMTIQVGSTNHIAALFLFLSMETLLSEVALVVFFLVFSRVFLIIVSDGLEIRFNYGATRFYRSDSI